MRKPQGSRGLLFGNKNKRDDRGSAIVIVIIAMALIGILASTILWASYLNYRIKINDLKVKNSFYSAETVVEQILAGVKKEIVSASVNEAYQEVASNWDALATDDNRESYFITAYIAAVESKLNASPTVAPTQYDKDVIKAYVDEEMWDDSDPKHDGYIVKATWDAADPKFRAANEINGYGSMSIRNICVEYYNSEGLLSIINTDIAIDVPKLRFTQAGTVDRLYPYVLIGDNGIVTKNDTTISINGSIYGGVDTSVGAADDNGGIQIGNNSHVTVEDASYIISGGDIVVGNDSIIGNLVHRGAELIVRDVSSGGVGFKTNVYAQGLAVNGSHLDISGRTFIANDLILSGRSSDVSLAGQYFGYGDTQKTKDVDESDNPVNPAETSSAIVINGRDSAVDLTGLNTLQLAGRAYVSLSENDEVNDLPHIMMGESISVKSNQIAYLVPAECVGTLTQGSDSRTIIGQNPMSAETWGKLIASVSEYAEDDTKEQEFKIVDAGKKAVKLGGEKLSNYGISDLNANAFSGLNTDDILETVTRLNSEAESSHIRFLYNRNQVYMYLVMEYDQAEEYFQAYYNVNSNKASLDSYFNQYVSGGIRLKDNVQGYTVLGNSMVSLTDAADGDRIQTSDEGENLVRLLSSVTLPDDEEGEGEDEGDEEQPVDPDAYTEVSDNVTNVTSVKSREELYDLIESVMDTYDNLNNNLLEDGKGMADTVFENLIRVDSTEGSESTEGLKDYLAGKLHGIAEFESAPGSGIIRAVLVDCSKQSNDTYKVSNSDLRLVIALGDVEVTSNFQGLIIASGTITVAGNVTCKKDGEGVYEALQATSVDFNANAAEGEDKGDLNVPANILYNGTGMIKSGYEEADVDENGNLNINYSEIVRYENWIKK